LLSDAESGELEAWLLSARRWCESSQQMVSAATELTNSSRALAVTVADRPPDTVSASKEDRKALAARLRLLAETIEDDGRELRDRFLTTETELELYRELLD
jgi:hypothetical protein